MSDSFEVTSNDASKTVIVGADQPAADMNQAEPASPASKGGKK